MCVLPSFEHLRKVCEPYIIFKETDVKLKRWSTFGLLRFRFPIHYPPPSNIFHPVLVFWNNLWGLETE